MTHFGGDFVVSNSISSTLYTLGIRLGRTVYIVFKDFLDFISFSLGGMMLKWVCVLKSVYFVDVLQRLSSAHI